MTSVSGIDFSGLEVDRQCGSVDYSTEGRADIGERHIYVATASDVTQKDVGMVTLHEMVHFVEWDTNDEQRKALYGHLGIETDGNYWTTHIDTGNDLSVWKRAPGERLAESVVQCAYGEAHFSGMDLVPRAECSAFMATFANALKVATGGEAVVENAPTMTDTVIEQAEPTAPTTEPAEPTETADAAPLGLPDTGN